MKALLVNTDYDWYRFLAARPEIEEVNFWKPLGGGGRTRAIQPGEPLIFKLKKKYGDAIVGFAPFVMDRTLPVQEAWDVFGEGNGVPTLAEMWKRIRYYVRRNRGEDARPNHTIGCMLLSRPVFFAEPVWVEGARDWKSNTVVGKGYDLSAGEGLRIWRDCLTSAQLSGLTGSTEGHVVDPPERYGTEQIIRPRLGQGTFRYAVRDAYGQCAVSREHSIPVLEAAHIIPYSYGGTHEVSNGLLLRADIHKLYDQGYVTVTQDHKFKVSGKLAEEFHNGRSYYQLDGSDIWIPDDFEYRPSRDALAFHAEQVFVG